MATPWLIITADLVLTKLSSPELVAFRSKATVAGQADPLPEIITQAVASVRQGIGSNANNVLAEGETVPIMHRFDRVALGTAIQVFPGCDLLPATCKDKWNNFANFGGHPLVNENLTLKAIKVKQAAGGKK